MNNIISIKRSLGLNCLALTLLLLVCACNKENCKKGVVTDSHTGKPVSGATVQFFYEYTEMGSIKQNYPYVKSNDAGEFYYCAEDKKVFNFYIMDVYKKGYAHGFNTVGDNVTLTPFDGYLKLNIVNETGAHDNILAYITNKCEHSLGQTFPYSQYTDPRLLPLLQGATYTEIFGCCAGDSTKIEWQFGFSDPVVGTNWVITKTNDTTFFEIKY